MTEANVEAGLKELSSCLREVQSLIAWAQLAEAETKPGTPPSFRFDHRVAEDLRNQTGLFIKMAMDLHEVLHEKTHECGSEADRARWEKRLLALEDQFRALDLTGTFIKA
jgi:hypothetical protein